MEFLSPPSSLKPGRVRNELGCPRALRKYSYHITRVRPNTSKSTVLLHNLGHILTPKYWELFECARMPSIRSANDNKPSASQRMSTPIERRGQTVTVTVAFTLTCAILCLGTRLYMRWPWRKLMGTNDILALSATVRSLDGRACTEFL